MNYYFYGFLFVCLRFDSPCLAAAISSRPCRCGWYRRMDRFGGFRVLLREPNQQRSFKDCCFSARQSSNILRQGAPARVTIRVAQHLILALPLEVISVLLPGTRVSECVSSWLSGFTRGGLPCSCLEGCQGNGKAALCVGRRGLHDRAALRP